MISRIDEISPFLKPDIISRGSGHRARIHPVAGSEVNVGTVDRRPGARHPHSASLYDLTILQSHQKHLNFPSSGQVIYPGNFGGHPFYSARLVYWEENRRTFDAI